MVVDIELMLTPMMAVIDVMSIFNHSLNSYLFQQHVARKSLIKISCYIKPSALSKISAVEFTQLVATLYATLDDFHPFSDGHSRILSGIVTVSDESIWLQYKSG